MTHKVIRRSLATGVAIAGASAITWSAVAVLPANEQVVAAQRVVTTEVTPVALASSLQFLAEAAAATLQQGADGLVTKLPALWNQVNVQWADADLTHWNYALVADSFLMPVAPLVFGPLNDAVAEVAAQAFPSLANEIRQVPGLIEYGVIRLIGPLLSAIGGAGAAHAQIFYSMSNWELQPFFEALAAAPGHVIDGFLNGGYGDLGALLTGEVGGTPIPAPGLLTPWGQAPTPRDIKWAPDTPGTVVESKTSVEEPSDTAIVPDEIVAEPVETVEPVEAVDVAVAETAAETVTEEEAAAEDAETSTPVTTADEADKDTESAQKSDGTEEKSTTPSRRSVQRTNADRTSAESSDTSTRKRFGNRDSRSSVRDSATKADASSSSDTGGE